MWFGTVLGLSRWDGARFTNFGAEHGLLGEGVEHMYEDRDGSLVTFSWMGGNIFRDGSFSPFFGAWWQGSR